MVVTNDAGSATSNDAILTVRLAPPTVATPASASPNPVAGTTTNLSVLGADGDGESNLTYTWSTIAIVGAPIPTFSINGTNAAKNTVATFSKAGVYTLAITQTIRNASGLSTTSLVNVTVNATPTSITITPVNVVVLTGNQQSFTATALDQFSNAMTPNFFMERFRWREHRRKRNFFRDHCRRTVYRPGHGRCDQRYRYRDRQRGAADASDGGDAGQCFSKPCDRRDDEFKRARR